jgi:hypothetical protein
MKYKITCTFTCEVEAEDMDMAFAEASNVLLVNANPSDAVISFDDGYEMEAEEMENDNVSNR